MFAFRHKHIHDYLHGILEKEQESWSLEFVSELTQELHIWPDYHGNRSPIADHTLKGMVSCLDMHLHIAEHSW